MCKNVFNFKEKYSNLKKQERTIMHNLCALTPNKQHEVALFNTKTN